MAGSHDFVKVMVIVETETFGPSESFHFSKKGKKGDPCNFPLEFTCGNLIVPSLEGLTFSIVVVPHRPGSFIVD